MKERAKLFGLDRVIDQIIQFPIKEEVDKHINILREQFPELIINEKKTTIFRLLSPKEEIERKNYLQALADKIMGPGFIPLTWEDIMSTYNEAKKHGKYK